MPCLINPIDLTTLIPTFAKLSLSRLDDIEDSSPLRRGRPATHIVFGSAQTTNTANYSIVEALGMIQKLDSKPCLDIFIGKLEICQGDKSDL